MKKTCLYWYIKFKKFIALKSYSRIVDEKENRARKLALKIITSADSILRVCPITNKKYVTNARYKISIIIDGNDVEFFTNVPHKVQFSPKNYYLIVNGFDRIAAKDRAELEKKIKKTMDSAFDEMYYQVFSK